MIVNVYNNGRVVYQSAEQDDGVPNEAVLVHVDNGGTLCLSQGADTIVLNRGTLKEIVAAAKDAIAAYDKAQTKRP